MLSNVLCNDVNYTVLHSYNINQYDCLTMLLIADVISQANVVKVHVGLLITN